MSYIGNEPISAAFLTDTFSGNGSTVAFTMSVAPANTSSILVAVTGVVQDPSTYSVSGTTLTFSAAPPTGTSNISVRYLGIPASGVTTTAYRTVTDTTATAGQTTFTIPSYTVGYVDVYRNGVRLAAADYTATTGTTVVLASAASAGDTITTESFYVSSVLNAIQQYNGTSVNQTLTTPTANTLTSASGSNLQLQTNGGTTALTLDTSGNAGLGVTPSAWYAGYSVMQLGAYGAVSASASYVGIGSNSYASGSSGWGSPKYLGSGYAPLYLQQVSNGQHQWYTAPSGTAGNAITFTQAMTLDASGYLLVGTASQLNSSALRAANNGISIRPDGQYIASCTASYCAVFNVNSTNTGQVLFQNNGVSVGSISSTGSATTYATSSDYRLKENIAPMTRALATVAALKPVTYTWKADGSDGQGFIAHELQAVVPDAVVGEKDAVDEDGNPKYQGIDTSFLVATLTAAIQEQQQIITQLQAQLTSVSADVAALKGQA